MARHGSQTTMDKVTVEAKFRNKAEFRGRIVEVRAASARGA